VNITTGEQMTGKPP